METVYVESYRLARELQQGDFALTVQLIDQSGILESITALMSPIDMLAGRLGAHLYKLNAYATGGFFKAHCDTPKSEHHIGSLVVALPVEFRVGEMRVSHEGKDVLFDWSKTLSSPISSENIRLPWAFLFSDVNHEVLPVTSGTRVTLAYDILVSEKSESPTPVIDGGTLPFYPDLRAMLKNPDFLPNGGKVAFALSRFYPVNKEEKSPLFASHLKGSDAALYRALVSLKISTALRTVLVPRNGSDALICHAVRERALPRMDLDQCSKSNFAQLFYTRPSITSDELKVSEDLVLEEALDARFEPEIIWA